ncbi:MAG: SDR family NAD(P)-dependent oxidoreductase, partial [Bacteroidota bacterium]
MSQTILITGATAGIGEAAARLFAKHNYRLILTGRRKERLQALEKELGVEVLSLVFDVRDQEAVKAAVASIPEDWRDIDILVNNAGLAVGLEPIHEGVVDDWERMIDTHVKGLLYISREISP